MHGMRVGELLRKAGLLDELQLRSAITRQTQWGGRLAKHVEEMGFAREDQIVDALASSLGLSKIQLGMLVRDPGAIGKVEVELAQEKGIFPYALRDNGKTLWIAMADPTDLETVDLLATRTGCRVRTVVAGENDILAAIARHYRSQEPVANLPPPPSASLVHAPPNPTGTDLESESEWPLGGFTPPRGMRVLGPLPETPAASPVSTAAEVQQLRTELEKATNVLRGLIDLLVEKGLISNEELRTSIARLISR